MIDSMNGQGKYKVGDRVLYYRPIEKLILDVEIVENKSDVKGIQYVLRGLRELRPKNEENNSVITCAKPHNAGSVAGWHLLDQEKLNELEASLT